MRELVLLFVRVIRTWGMGLDWREPSYPELDAAGLKAGAEGREDWESSVMWRARELGE